MDFNELLRRHGHDPLTDPEDAPLTDPLTQAAEPVLPPEQPTPPMSVNELAIRHEPPDTPASDPVQANHEFQSEIDRALGGMSFDELVARHQASEPILDAGLDPRDEPSGLVERAQRGFRRAGRQFVGGVLSATEGLGTAAEDVGLEVLKRRNPEAYEYLNKTPGAMDLYRDTWRRSTVGLLSTMPRDKQEDLQRAATEWIESAQAPDVRPAAATLFSEEQKDWYKSLDWWTDRPPEVIAQVGMMLGSSVIHPAVGLGSMAAMSGGLQRHEAMERMRERGFDDHDVRMLALGEGIGMSAVTGVTNVLPLSFMRGLTPKTRSELFNVTLRNLNKKLPAVATSTLAEALQEVTEETSSMLLQRWFEDDPEAFVDMSHRLAMSAALGGTGGFAGGIPRTLGQWSRAQRKASLEALHPLRQMARQAQRTEHFIDQISEIEHTPEGWQRLVNLATTWDPSRADFERAGLQPAAGRRHLNAQEREEFRIMLATALDSRLSQASREAGETYQLDTALNNTPGSLAETLHTLRAEIGQSNHPATVTQLFDQIYTADQAQQLRADPLEGATPIDQAQALREVGEPDLVTPDTDVRVDPDQAVIVQPEPVALADPEPVAVTPDVSMDPATFAPEDTARVQVPEDITQPEVGEPGPAAALLADPDAETLPTPAAMISESARQQREGRQQRFIEAVIEAVRQDADFAQTASEQQFFGTILPRAVTRVKRKMGHHRTQTLGKKARETLASGKPIRQRGADFDKLLNQRGHRAIVRRALDDYDQFVEQYGQGYEDYYYVNSELERQAIIARFPEFDGPDGHAYFAFYQALSGLSSAQTDLVRNTHESILAYEGFRETGRLPIVMEDGTPVQQLPPDPQGQFDVALKHDVDRMVSTLEQIQSDLTPDELAILRGDIPVPKGLKSLDPSLPHRSVSTVKSYAERYLAFTRVTSAHAAQMNTSSRPMVASLLREFANRGPEQFRARVRSAIPAVGPSRYNKIFNYHAMNQLLARPEFQGPDGRPDIGALVAWLNERVSWQELQAEKQRLGYGKIPADMRSEIQETVYIAEGQDQEIPRTFIFGPKVGAYILNRIAAYDPRNENYVTMDVWESRFWRNYNNDVPDGGSKIAVGVARQVYLRQARDFAKAYEERHGRPMPASAGQAGRWYLIKRAAAEMGYTKAAADSGMIPDIVANHVDAWMRGQLGMRDLVIDSELVQAITGEQDVTVADVTPPVMPPDATTPPEAQHVTRTPDPFEVSEAPRDPADRPPTPERRRTRRKPDDRRRRRRRPEATPEAEAEARPAPDEARDAPEVADPTRPTLAQLREEAAAHSDPDAPSFAPRKGDGRGVIEYLSGRRASPAFRVDVDAETGRIKGLKPKSAKRIVRDILSRIGITATQFEKGEMPNAAGFYAYARRDKFRTVGYSGMRLALRRDYMANIGVAAHEVAHHIDDILNVTGRRRMADDRRPDGARTDVPALLDNLPHVQHALAQVQTPYMEYNRARHAEQMTEDSRGSLIAEGWAEAVRLYVMSRGDPASVLPEAVYDFMESVFTNLSDSRAREAGALIARTRQDVQSYHLNQSDADLIQHNLILPHQQPIDPSESHFARQDRASVFSALRRLFSLKLFNNIRDVELYEKELESRFKEDWTSLGRRDITPDKAWAQVVQAAGGKASQLRLGSRNFISMNTEHAILHGVIDPFDMQATDPSARIVGPSAKDALADLTDAAELKEFGQYIYASVALYRVKHRRHKQYDKWKETNDKLPPELRTPWEDYTPGETDIATMQRFVDTIEADVDKAPRYRKARNKVTKYFNDLLKLRLYHGLMTEGEYDLITSNHMIYMPFLRQFSAAVDQAPIERGQPIRRLKLGSVMPVLDVYDAMIERTQAIYTELTRHNIRKSFVDLAQESGIGGQWVRRLPEKPNNMDNVMEIKQGDESSYYRVDPDLYRQIEGHNNPQLAGMQAKLLRMVGAQTKWSAYFMVAASPYFTLRNAPRDIKTTWIKGLHDTTGIEDKQLISPGVSTVSVIKGWAPESMRKQSDVDKLYHRLGGTLETRVRTMAGDSLYGSKFNDWMSDISKRRLFLRDDVDRPLGDKFVSGMQRMVKGIEALNNTIELAPRRAAFIRTLKMLSETTDQFTLHDDGRIEGEVPQWAWSQAMFNAQEITTNFNRRGEWAAVLDKLFVFYNAAKQGTYSQIMTLAKAAGGKGPLDAQAWKNVMGLKTPHARRLVLSMTLGIAAKGMALWAMANMAASDDPDDDTTLLDHYWEIPDYLKKSQDIFLFRMPGMGDSMVSLSLGNEREWNLISKTAEEMLWKPVFSAAGFNIPTYDRNVPDWVGDQATDLFFERVPVSGGVASVTMQSLFNYDIFRNKPIENRWDQEAHAEYRYDDRTSSIAQQLSMYGGRHLGISPKMIDFWGDNTLGSMFRKGSDFVAGAAADLRDEEFSLNTIVNANTPFIGPLLADPTARQSINDFYILRQRNTQDMNAWEKMDKDYTPAARAKIIDDSVSIGVGMSVMRAIRDSDDIDDIDKARYMTGMARWVLGRDPSDKYPNPLIQYQDLPTPVKRQVIAALKSARNMRVRETDHAPRGSDKWRAKQDARKAVTRRIGETRRAHKQETP
jgi:hypothetical protein